jgi:hypothetical protein
VLYSPVVALAAWHVLASLVSRIHTAREVSAATTRASLLVSCGCGPTLVEIALAA